MGINSKPDPTKKQGYRLCGDVDFSDVEDVCGPLEAPDVVAKLDALRDKCGRLKVERAWTWGF